MSQSDKHARQPSEEAVTDLSVFDAGYAAARVPQKNEVPDGKYPVRVQCVELTRNPAGGPILKWDLLVVAGQFSGWHIFKRVTITEATLPIIKADLTTLGLTLAKLSDLPHYLESLHGKTLEVTKRTKKGYMNVYFHKQSRSKPSSRNTDDAVLL
ncbi:MAG: DUF669 domain-containing protein [Thermoguttaceae bacterium]